MITLAGVALVLDAVDGNVARRTATASAFGARFDMEVDAFIILTLSVFVAPAYGAWVLTIGAMRYVVRRRVLAAALAALAVAAAVLAQGSRCDAGHRARTRR